MFKQSTLSKIRFILYGDSAIMGNPLGDLRETLLSDFRRKKNTCNGRIFDDEDYFERRERELQVSYDLEFLKSILV
jgi:hypothetical protein